MSAPHGHCLQHNAQNVVTAVTAVTAIATPAKPNISRVACRGAVSVDLEKGAAESQNIWLRDSTTPLEIDFRCCYSWSWIFTVVLAGTSAVSIHNLSDLGLDLKLAMQTDSVVGFNIPFSLPLELAPFLSNSDSTLILFVFAIGMYCTSTGLIYHQQVNGRLKDLILVYAVSTGAVVGYASGMDHEEVIFRVLPGFALCALIATSFLTHQSKLQR